jgi:putative hydrolase of the HAD superfamily
MRKPDVEIYRFVLDAHDLKPSETLFIDDLQANIDGASKAGLKTFLMEKDKVRLETFFIIEN